jgi:hypothetical protein
MLPPGNSPEAASGVSLAKGDVTYRGWTISYDPPPIPVRDCDWQFSHPDFDASYEGPEDGWVGNGLCGSGASVEDCKAQIDDMEDDR